MGQFDNLFSQGKKAPASVPAQVPTTTVSAPAQVEEPGPIPHIKLHPNAQGKAEYQAFSAPKYERREWFFILPRFGSRMGAPEMLRFDLLYRIPFSPDGSMFALIYVDQVYLFKGKHLQKAVENIADRYLDQLQEYDPTTHYILETDDPIITSIESFMRRDPNLPDWVKPGNKAEGAPTA